MGSGSSNPRVCGTSRSSPRSAARTNVGGLSLQRVLAGTVFSLFVAAAWSHGVADRDAAYLEGIDGAHLIPLMYLGAKHMVTGYDHLLFLAGVIFFLYRIRDVALYATLFALGHSATLLTGVLAGIRADPHIVDAIIGLSVVYKAFENIGGFKRMGMRIDTRLAVALFGLAHGFGLSTKLQDLDLSQDGLVVNMLAFNIGVELGQFAALAVMLVALSAWRTSGTFERSAYGANVLIMMAGFVLFGHQVSGYLLG